MSRLHWSAIPGAGWVLTRHDGGTVSAQALVWWPWVRSAWVWPPMPREVEPKRRRERGDPDAWRVRAEAWKDNQGRTR